MYEHILQIGRLTTTDTQQGDPAAREFSHCGDVHAGILVTAFGNSLRGDDGIGPAVLQALAKLDELPREIVLLEGDAWALASALQSTCYRRVILLDAMDMGCPPGVWQRLDLGEHSSFKQKVRQQADTHKLNLDTMLALLEIIGVPLPELIVYGVQPQAMSWSAGLSESVQKTIPTLCKQILKDIRKDAVLWLKY
jgi:hydrogenase maturation protease